MKREFCSTVYIFKENKVLLHLHQKFQKYLPPGGHFEKDETPEEAAIREVYEETGLTIDFIQQENLLIDFPHAKSIVRPYLCLLENIDRPLPHQHIDFIFLAKPINEKKPLEPFRYFSLEEIEDLEKQDKIFKDSLLVVKKVLEEELIKI